MTDGGPGEETGSGERILVVDDDPFIVRLLEIELGAAGYDVLAAADGATAMSEAVRHVPDLVLADVMMPNMDGFELLQALRANPKTVATPVILLTARGLSEDKQRGFSIGADDYIVKPFEPTELLARVQGVLRRARLALAQSPSTGLPGNVQTETEVNGRIERGEPFALLAIDLDGFADFNDHYGFERGDAVIRATAVIIEEVAAEAAGGDAFVGHLGADGFLAVVPPTPAEQIAGAIIERFDAAVTGFYDVADRERGFIEVTSRSGELHRRSPLTLSIGIVSTEHHAFERFSEALTRVTRTRRRARSEPASSWVVDERRE